MREGARLESWEGDDSDIEWQGLLRSLEPHLGSPASSQNASRPARAHETSTQPSSDQDLDLRFDFSLSLEDAFFGKTVEVEIPDGDDGKNQRIAVSVPIRNEDQVAKSRGRQ